MSDIPRVVVIQFFHATLSAHYAHSNSHAHFQHVWHGGRQVDGKSSLACYLMTLDRCYARLCAKYAQRATAGPCPDSASAPDASAADRAAADRASARLASANQGAHKARPGLVRGSSRAPSLPAAGRSAFSLTEVPPVAALHAVYGKHVKLADDLFLITL